MRLKQNEIIMKNYLIKTFLWVIMTISFSTVANAQLAVQIRPEIPVLPSMPIAPSTKHVWISGEWVRRGENYAYIDGHWAIPSFRHHRWVGGHWKNTKQGWVWVHGYWK